MNFPDYFPIWDQLNQDQKDRLSGSLMLRSVPKGTILHNGDMDCTGLLLVKAGQLRAYILSDEGREITLYRLFDRDMCLFSASCMMRSIQFEVTIEAEKDSQLWIIPPEVYQRLMEESAPVANYTNELMASRFSEVMWLMEQIMWRSLDKRLAAFLLEEAAIEGTDDHRQPPGLPPGGDHPDAALLPERGHGEAVPGHGDHSGPGEAGGAGGLNPPALWTQGCFPAFALQMSWVMVPMGQ